MRWLAWAGLVVVVVAALGGAGASSRMSLVSQGFEDVVVGISPQLDERRATAYIASLKKALNETSHALFKATGNRLFIRKVKILVPISWKNVRVDQEASSESYENSDLRVAPKNGAYGDQVYTLHVMGCGEPGQYIHVTPAYLTHPGADKVWGPRGKVLAQAWATLRWGVFDERGYPDDPEFPLFYDSTEREFLEPNHCSNQELYGRHSDPNTGRGCNPRLNANCRFVPDQDQQTATTSLMSFTTLDSIEKFCGLDDDNGSHNAEAPNKHNKKCDGRSVGAVMADHQDFLNTTPLPVDHPVDPEVVVVQEVVAKFVLVLDYSGSMSGQKIENLVGTAKRWLLHQVADGSFVAIIKFESGVRAVRGLTEVSDRTRQDLANEITPDASGGTCIGCGLEKALELLKKHNNKVIVLISDGAENESPMMADVMDDVVRSGARVTTIAYGKAAEQKMEELAQNTGGKVNFVPDADTGKSMADAFQASETYQPGQAVTNTNIQIHEEDVTLSGTVATGTFIVDSTVGRNLRFELHIKSAGQSGTPYLTSPTGVQYTHAEFTLNLWIIKVDLAESGTWTWTLPAGPSNTDATIKVTAQARDPDILPIYTEAWMSTGTNYVNAASQNVIVFARVTQGGSPVVGARVRAYITRPDDSEVPLNLKDDGKFADAQKGDGVYSSFFMNFAGVGRYAVKAQVWDDGNSYVNNGFINSRRSKRSLVTPGAPDQLDVREPCCGSVVPFDKKTATPTGSFTRTAPGGSFHVTNAPPAGSDSFPPARVLDLSANIKNSTAVTLTWTAPGDDQDAGTVSGYVIWMSDDPAALASNLNDKSTTLLLDFETSSHMAEVLKEAGEEITLEVTLQEPLKHETLYAVALQAVDDVGNRSKLSTLGKFATPAKPQPKGKFVAFFVAGCVAGLGLITGSRYLGYS